MFRWTKACPCAVINQAPPLRRWAPWLAGLAALALGAAFAWRHHSLTQLPTATLLPLAVAAVLMALLLPVFLWLLADNRRHQKGVSLALERIRAHHASRQLEIIFSMVYDYQQKTGRLPDSLEGAGLSPRLLRNPWGRAWRYHRQDGFFTVESEMPESFARWGRPPTSNP